MKEVESYKDELISTIDISIDSAKRHDSYSIGLRNGMRYVRSLIDGKEPDYEKVGGNYGSNSNTVSV